MTKRPAAYDRRRDARERWFEAGQINWSYKLLSPPLPHIAAGTNQSISR